MNNQVKCKCGESGTRFDMPFTMVDRCDSENPLCDNCLIKQDMIEVATTIRSQISIATLMACGARKWAVLDNGLAFRVGSDHKTQFIYITLDPSDTYKVELKQVNRKTWQMKTLKELAGVYCDMLSDIVYDMVNKSGYCSA